MTKEDLALKIMYTLKCTKEQFILITKALTSNMRVEEIEIAREYGLEIMNANVAALNDKAHAAEHALNLAQEKK